MTPEQQRRQSQLAFAASRAELEVGSLAGCPLPLEQLLATRPGSPWVRRHFAGGLTADVYQLEASGRLWTLKRARHPCKVQNPDGQTSFLNEVQRRGELQALKRQADWHEALAGIVDTRYASYRQGLLLSPWIAGEAIAEWDERRLLQLFDTLLALLQLGFFEWDLCPGNLLDDGRIRLFDFGYMYRFDPLRDCNSNGLLTPQHHGAERFETRCYYAYLLRLEQERGQGAALAALELEKRIALECYQRLRSRLIKRGASASVLGWLGNIIGQWHTALRGGLDGLYLREAWRSHLSDLEDDLGGQTCTPLTLQRIGWLQQCLQECGAQLQRLELLAGRTPDAWRAELEQALVKAHQWQVGG
ncbi:hypothetical protein [Ectopseudomonas guguanensis]|uniref:Phosphotransferase enzyme family protein n=1 Tax=Ectopseudomonas guguanensis TaxID=1198456 RepID=A0A1H0WJ30_9GAMM|nr:hypothetical protein [Pseudomonas guguanensis]SDP90593.1 hypothetical protein SAMN05216213_107104 [Pseudomonas guguanensis]